MSDAQFGAALLGAVLLGVGAVAGVDLWRRGERWPAILLWLALWVIALIAIAIRLTY